MKTYEEMVMDFEDWEPISIEDSGAWYSDRQRAIKEQLLKFLDHAEMRCPTFQCSVRGYHDLENTYYAVNGQLPSTKYLEIAGCKIYLALDFDLGEHGVIFSVVCHSDETGEYRNFSIVVFR